MIRQCLVAVSLCVSFPVMAALQAGDTAPLPADTNLQTRPVPDAEVLVPVPAGTPVTLITRAVNSSGAWWYVNTGDRNGWLAETSIAPPPAVAPEPAAVVAPVPMVAPAPVAAPAAAAPATPAPTLMTAAGMREFELDADLSQSSDDFDDESSLSIYLKYGYFTTPNHELGLTVQFVEASDTTAVGVGPFYRYNAPSPGSTTVPFFGLSAVYTHLEMDDVFEVKGPEFEASIGMRHFIGDNASINVSLYYAKASFDVESVVGDGSFDVTRYGVRIGLSGYLR